MKVGFEFFDDQVKRKQEEITAQARQIEVELVDSARQNNLIERAAKEIGHIARTAADYLLAKGIEPESIVQLVTEERPAGFLRNARKKYEPFAVWAVETRSGWQDDHDQGSWRSTYSTSGLGLGTDGLLYPFYGESESSDNPRKSNFKPVRLETRGPLGEDVIASQVSIRNEEDAKKIVERYQNILGEFVAQSLIR